MSHAASRATAAMSAPTAAASTRGWTDVSMSPIWLDAIILRPRIAPIAQQNDRTIRSWVGFRVPPRIPVEQIANPAALGRIGDSFAAAVFEVRTHTEGEEDFDDL